MTELRSTDAPAGGPATGPSPPATVATEVWRFVMVGALAVACIVQSVRQWQLVSVGTDGFRIGDWLINYAGGPVRRGLVGSVLGAILPTAEAELIGLWVIQTALYAVIFGVAILWVLKMAEPGRWAMVFLSPAFLLVSLADVEGTHRKEIITMAALALLGYAISRGRRVTTAVVASAVLFAIGAFAHELNALLVAPFLILVWWAAKRGQLSQQAANLGMVAFAAATAAGLLVGVAAPGTVEQQRAICVDLVARGFSPDVCSGSIRHIGDSTTDALADVTQLLPDYLMYVPLAALAALPFLAVPWARLHWRTLLLATIGVLPLFVVAMDWGRWIALAVFIATVLTYVGARHDGGEPPRVAALVVVAYLVLWSLPHHGPSPWNALGWADVVPHPLVRTLIGGIRGLFGG